MTAITTIRNATFAWLALVLALLAVSLHVFVPFFLKDSMARRDWHSRATRDRLTDRL
jgi:hypothetical protein